MTRYEGEVGQVVSRKIGSPYSLVEFDDPRWPNAKQTLVIPETLPIGAKIIIDLKLEGE